MSHYTDKTHFFRDENDDRTTVVTSMHNDTFGFFYEADLIEHPVIMGSMYGVGGTRMEAIADLQKQIELELAK
jgi:hypothetical protein